VLEHVVIVTDSLAVDGGSAIVALGSARALADRGLRVTVFAASGQASAALTDCANVRIVSTGQGEALASADRIGGALRGLWNFPAAARMDALLATLDPTRTVVHIHAWTKAITSSVIASVVRAKFPIVLTLHEYFTACPTGCLYLHRDRKVCTMKPMSLECITTNCDSRNYGFKLYRVLRQFIARTAGRVPGGILNFITVSAFSRRIIEPMLPAVSKYHPIPYAIDAVHQERATAESNRPFVFVGRLSAEKGGALLAEAARRAGVPVVFVGDGTCRAEIESINPDATFAGWLDREGVAAQMRSARCLVVPSLWYETFGLVVQEAAALGIPAIVPRGTVPGDLVEHGVTGLQFERGDVDDLTAQLAACTDDAMIARLSRTTYEAYWAAPPSMTAHVDLLIVAYRNVLAEASPAAEVAPALLHHSA
jgi:glycosyltransferase involved in cell wall biosynthesis